MPEKNRGADRITVALAGTSNVGKSAIFHKITGADVIISNYPGTTVELLEGMVRYRGQEIKVVDLPGVYSLGAVSEDEIVARRAILEQNPDVIMNIVDASNLERSLYLTLQLLALGRPMVVVLNMYDVALAEGERPDPKLLSKRLGVPVVSTVATRGKNVEKAFDQAIKLAGKKGVPRKTIKMGADLEVAVDSLSKQIKHDFHELPLGLPTRTIAVRLLEGDAYVAKSVALVPGSERVLRKARALARDIARRHGEPAAFRVAKERHALSSSIAQTVTTRVAVKPMLGQKIDRLTTNTKTGVPIMVGVFVGLLLLLFYVGGFIEGLLMDGWETYVSPTLSSAFGGLGPAGQVLDIGINQGIAGILAVMIPYILVFFLTLGLLEDIGYLPRMAYVMDSVMHRIGLHGRAVVPLLGGFGCNVPAIMATRTLTTRRERLLANTLITMIPCSARTAIILGTVGVFLGLKYAAAMYAIILALIFIVGWLLNRWLKGKVSGMIMEMPPLRRPVLKPVLQKTWMRMKHFIYVAIPLLLLGGLVIGALQVSGAMDSLVAPFSPLTVGWLGLPAVAIIPLIYGFIRKEGALVLLVAVAGTSQLNAFMSPLQLFVFALVAALYVPCIATVAVLAKELGKKDAALISVGTFLLALLVGGLFFHLNPFGL
ncbi:MAG: ferrous iron transport protein B [Candidatus Hadarchaeota archaeon]